MKKFICSILCFFMIFALTACNNETPEPTTSETQTQTITLTKDNYNKYITFNLTIEDIYMEDNTIYQLCSISTSKLNNCQFDNVWIAAYIEIYDDEPDWYFGLANRVFLNLDYNGYSKNSFMLKKSNATSFDYLTLNTTRVKIGVISGEVII